MSNTGQTGPGPGPGPNPFGNPTPGPQLNATLNNVVLCYIVPPLDERPHSSWRAICYTEQEPQKIFHEFGCLPSKIFPHSEIMKQEICDPDHMPAHLIQLTEKDQFIYIEGDICKVLSVEITLADGHNDPYIKRGKRATKPKKKKSAIIIPGQPSGGGAQSIKQIITNNQQTQAPMGSIDLSNVYIVDVIFATHGETDQALVDHVKAVAWNKGLTVN